MKEIKIVILNGDECNDVMGILTIRNLNFPVFAEIFSTYKEKLGDAWSWNGFLEWLESCKIFDFTWENHDATSDVWQYSV